MKMFLSLFFLLAFCLVTSSFTQDKTGDSLKLDALLKANSYELSAVDGNLTGSGLEFLLKATASTQFFVIGEPHNSREAPEITTMLFKVLHGKRGFDYLALEQDPVMAQMVSAPAAVGRRDYVVLLAKKYPNAFTFITDQELEMISQARAISSGKQDRIWGLDQVFGPIHVLDRLIEFAPSAAVRSRTLKLIEVLKQREAERVKQHDRYTMADASEIDELNDLLGEYQTKKSSEAEFLVSQMILSARIYKNNQLAENGQPTGYQSNFEREENMKWLFMREYRKARIADARMPKVLVKLGHYHAIRGRSWSNVLSLGNFVSEFAKSSDLDSFHLALYVNNAAGDYGVLSSYPEYKALADAAPTDRWTVIDLRPLRKYAHAGKFAGLTNEMRRIIFGFDAVLMLGGGSRGTYKLFGVE